MPIRPENRDRYPADWSEISLRIKRDRAGWRCECRGECGRKADHLAKDGRCRNEHNTPIWGADDQRKLVCLTTAHRNHVPEDCRPENLFAACQGCHLHYDIDHHRQTREQTRTAELLAQMDTLFDIDGMGS
jgi:hypothetical protein